MKRTSNSRNTKQPLRRGFATALVLGSMVFLTSAIVGMTSLFTHEVRRTRAMLAQTQLRQLLQAGVPTAQAELLANGTTERDLAMPVPVEGAAMSLHISAGTRPADEANVRLAGSLRGFRASQTVKFTRVAGGWVVTDAQLDQTGQQ
jgi:hypothetical protein